MIRKSSRLKVPKRHFESQYTSDNIDENNNYQSISSDLAIRKKNTTLNDFNDNIINLTGVNVFELKSILDNQLLDSSTTTHKGTPIIGLGNQIIDQSFSDIELEKLQEIENISQVYNYNSNFKYDVDDNNYTSTLETIVEIDAINIIKKILASNDDIWSLCPAKIADEIEINSRKPIGKRVKRMIECLVIGLTYEILLYKINKTGEATKVNDFIGREVVKTQNKVVVSKKWLDEVPFDDIYDIEVEPNNVDNCNYDKTNGCFGNKFKRYNCETAIAWRVPIRPIKSFIQINKVQDIFTTLDPRNLERIKTVNLSSQVKSQQLNLFPQYMDIMKVINEMIDEYDLDDEVRGKLRQIALAITFQA